jgi:hypothetical protein
MNATRKKFVSVIPLSKQAKIRFSEDMDLFHSCLVENETETMFYLQSLNKQYRFCVEKGGNCHWRIEK